MKKICQFLLILAILAIFSSCCHTKPAATGHNITSTADSSNTEINNRIIHHHDTVLVPVPVESRQSVGQQTSHLETSVATSDAFIDSLGQLHHNLVNKDTTLSASKDIFVPVSDTNRYESHTKVDSIYIPEPYPVEKIIEKPLTWYQELFIRIGIIATLILLVYITVTIYRKVHPS